MSDCAMCARPSAIHHHPLAGEAAICSNCYAYVERNSDPMRCTIDVYWITGGDTLFNGGAQCLDEALCLRAQGAFSIIVSFQGCEWEWWQSEDAT